MYAADGHRTQHYHVAIIENPLIDFNAKRSSIALPDGAKWGLNAVETKADPNAMAAIQGVAQSVTMAAVAAIKFMGVP